MGDHGCASEKADMPGQVFLTLLHKLTPSKALHNMTE
jgi:hypothetical protein